MCGANKQGHEQIFRPMPAPARVPCSQSSQDNLAEYACAGLVSSGVSVPGQLDVVVHCNFPAVLGMNAQHPYNEKRVQAPFSRTETAAASPRFSLKGVCG
jgi:hypothetical protein